MAQLLVRTSGFVVAATSCFRVDAQMYALVVVKAEVSFGSGIAPGEPRLTTPQPIDEARDLAPYLPAAQILLAPPRGPAADAVRLVVGRRDRMLVDVVGALATIARPVAREERATRLLAAMRPGGEPAPVDGAFDWSALFEAPPERRLDSLRGDEWVQLGGARTLSMRLPPVRAEARLHGKGALRKGRPLTLCCDTLLVDADAGTLALFWRASLPVADLDALVGLRVAVGVAMGGDPIPWTDPFAEPAPPPATAAPGRPPPPLGLGGTLVQEESSDEIARARRMVDALRPFTRDPAAPTALAAPGAASPAAPARRPISSIPPPWAPPPGAPPPPLQDAPPTPPPPEPTTPLPVVAIEPASSSGSRLPPT